MAFFLLAPNIKELKTGRHKCTSRLTITAVRSGNPDQAGTSLETPKTVLREISPWFSNDPLFSTNMDKQNSPRRIRGGTSFALPVSSKAIDKTFLSNK
jgi:hypothetical protein